MRIEAYTQVQQLYNTKKASKTQAAAKRGLSDQLQISSIGHPDSQSCSCRKQ